MVLCFQERDEGFTSYQRAKIPGSVPKLNPDGVLNSAKKKKRTSVLILENKMNNWSGRFCLPEQENSYWILDNYWTSGQLPDKPLIYDSDLLVKCAAFLIHIPPFCKNID